MEEAFGALEDEADAPELRRRADVRYRHQSFELTIDADDLGELAEGFHTAHERRYGYRMEEEPLELVNVRLVATTPVDKPPLRAEPAGDDEDEARRRACFDGDWSEVPVHSRASLGPGDTVEGPAVVELAEATCVVRPGWRGQVDDAGALVLER